MKQGNIKISSMTYELKTSKLQLFRHNKKKKKKKKIFFVILILFWIFITNYSVLDFRPV